MKQILFTIMKSFIASGLKTLIALYEKKNGEEKANQIKSMAKTITVALRPMAIESKTHVDDDILDIIEEALKP